MPVNVYVFEIRLGIMRRNAMKLYILAKIVPYVMKVKKNRSTRNSPPSPLLFFSRGVFEGAGGIDLIRAEWVGKEFYRHPETKSH